MNWQDDFFLFKGSTVAREASDKEKVMFLLKHMCSSYPVLLKEYDFLY